MALVPAQVPLAAVLQLDDGQGSPAATVAGMDDGLLVSGDPPWADEGATIGTIGIDSSLVVLSGGAGPTGPSTGGMGSGRWPAKAPSYSIAAAPSHESFQREQVLPAPFLLIFCGMAFFLLWIILQCRHHARLYRIETGRERPPERQEWDLP